MADVIWFDKTLTKESAHGLDNYTMGHHLGFEWVELGPNYLSMRMPVDDRTKQPYGILHGGASCALAETVGSLAASYTLDPDRKICVGLDINANHLKAVRSGFVTGRATPVHIGKSTQVWEIRITNEKDELVCISRLTMAILDKPADAIAKV